MTKKAESDPPALTVRQAWAAAARLWESPERCGCGCGRPVASGLANAAGLCATLGVLRFRRQITEAQEERMLAALPAGGTAYVEGVRPFLWPTTDEGAAARAAFCREQAAKGAQ